MLKKKYKEIVIGTNNNGKLREIKDLLPKSYKISSPKDYKLKSPKKMGKLFLKIHLLKLNIFPKKQEKSV